MDAQSYYRQSSVETATPGQLVSMLYHGAVAATVRGSMHVESGDPDGANRELQKAQDIVLHLRRTLDFEKGGSLARNLDSLYDFCLDRLITGNIRKDVALLDEVRSTLAGMAANWDEMLAGQQHGVANHPEVVGVAG